MKTALVQWHSTLEEEEEEEEAAVVVEEEEVVVDYHCHLGWLVDWLVVAPLSNLLLVL